MPAVTRWGWYSPDVEFQFVSSATASSVTETNTVVARRRLHV